MTAIDLSRGLEADRPAWTQYTDVEILQAIRQVADLLETNPTATEFDEHTSGPTHSTASNRFGSWVTAKQMAGVGGNVRLCDVNRTYFQEIDSHEKAYYLGLIFADGTITQTNTGMAMTICLQERDSGIVERLKNDIDSEHSISSISYDDPNHSDQVQFSVTNRRFCEHLQSQGIETNKSDTDTIPDIQPCYRSAFIRGVSDGDGGVRYDRVGGDIKASWRITNKSKERLEELYGWIKNWGIDSGGVHSGFRGVNVLSVSKPENIVRAYSVLYPFGNETYPKMERKYNSFSGVVQVINNE